MRAGTALATINRDQILDDLSKGKRLRDIGNELSITPQSISQALVNDPGYQAALESGLDARMCMYEDMLASREVTPTMTDIARAKALLSHAEFRASVECKSRWGKDATPATLIAPVFNVIIQSNQPTYTFDDTDK